MGKKPKKPNSLIVAGKIIKYRVYPWFKELIIVGSKNRNLGLLGISGFSGTHFCAAKLEG